MRCVAAFALSRCNGGMLRLLRLLLVLVTRFSCSRRDLLLENLALSRQLISLKQKHPSPRVAISDRLFWMISQRFWSGCKRAMIFVQPETVLCWHRAGFKLYWDCCRGIEPERARVGHSRRETLEFLTQSQTMPLKTITSVKHTEHLNTTLRSSYAYDSVRDGERVRVHVLPDPQFC
jgi:hypothetical protein